MISNEMQHDIEVAMKEIAEKYGYTDFYLYKFKPTVLSYSEIGWGASIEFVWENKEEHTNDDILTQ